MELKSKIGNQTLNVEYQNKKCIKKWFDFLDGWITIKEKKETHTHATTHTAAADINTCQKIAFNFNNFPGNFQM